MTVSDAIYLTHHDGSQVDGSRWRPRTNVMHADHAEHANHAHRATDTRVEAVPLPPSDDDLAALAGLLASAVETGSGLSFLAPLPLERATAWWRGFLATAGTACLVARQGDAVVGTVSVVPAWAPNQPHRAEIVKLIVAPGARGRGVGAALMRAAEDVARRAGRTLLTLDTVGGSDAERLYDRLGWVRVGTIPRFALDPDGRSMHDAVVFYRELARDGRKAAEPGGDR